MIIKKLLGLIGMNDQIHLVISPTVRESDGLAMSSRNARLSADARQRASVIYESLEDLKKNLRKGSLEEAKRKALKRLRDDGFRPDYVEIADADSLQLVGEWDGKQRLVALAAAFLDEVRLIDNMLISP
jgi:pantoate--beta-alanine ligase